MKGSPGTRIPEPRTSARPSTSSSGCLLCRECSLHTAFWPGLSPTDAQSWKCLCTHTFAQTGLGSSPPLSSHCFILTTGRPWCPASLQSQSLAWNPGYNRLPIEG